MLLERYGVERATGRCFGSVSHPILAVFSSMYFVCYPTPRHKIAWGVHYIVDLGQDKAVGSKIALKGRTRGKVGPTMWSSSEPAWCPLFFASSRSPLTSSSHAPLFPEKLTWQKVWVCLTFERSI
jgi:hypothetical protein